MQDGTKQTEAKVGILKECMRQVGDIPRCIDDRWLMNITEGSLPVYVVRPEEANGPQFLGGSLGIFALLVEHYSVTNQELDFTTLFNITTAIHEEQGWQLGVHMDNHHDGWDEIMLKKKLEEIQSGELGNSSIIPGCGFAGLLSREDNPLGLSQKAHAFFKSYPNIVDEFVRRGAKLSILGGNHAPKENAMATENMDTGKTLDTEKAISNGVQSYNHDTGSLKAALSHLDDGVASSILATNKRWLSATTNLLAGMDPKPLPTAA